MGGRLRRRAGGVCAIALAIALAALVTGCAAPPRPGGDGGTTVRRTDTAPIPLSMTSDEEVPFVTTPDRVTVALLELADVGPADRVLDLGSGDGRIVITAASRYGARGLGVEIVPELVERSRDHARRAGVADRAEFRTQDLFDTDLSAASVITMYLLPEVNLRLRPRLLALAPGTRIVSHDWDLGDWSPDRTLTLDVPEKTIGRDKRSRLHRWTVPARLAGLWCAATGASLQVAQQYQQLSATLAAGGEQRGFSGLVDGARLRLVGAGGAGWSGTLDADGLHVDEASAGLPLQAGQRLQRAGGERCEAGGVQ